MVRSRSPSPEKTTTKAGLANKLKGAASPDDQQLVAMIAAGLSVDASTQLGLNFQQNQYEQRRKALISPDEYASSRATAYGKLTKSVNDAFTEAATKYTTAGLPPDMAKQYALQAARNEHQIQQQIFELQYPSGANILELNAQTTKFKGLGGVAPQARRAPARRRARRR